MSRFGIRKGNKFGCIAINTWVSRDLVKPLKVDGFWFSFTPLLSMLRTWKKSLGTFRVEDFGHTNFFIIAQKHAQNIDMLDGDNKELERLVTNIYYGLQLQGVGRHKSYGFLLTGASKNGRKEVRSYSPLLAHFETYKTMPASVDEPTIKKAVEISRIIGMIYDDSENYIRLKRGFKILLQALREGIALARLHQLVRALEAIIMPEVGRTRRQFIHRCQLFISRSDNTREMLGEIFDLRSREEHLNDIDEILTEYNVEEIDKIIAKRTLQIELIVEHVYTKILNTQNIRQFFINDTTINEFWSQRDHEISGVWGETFNIRTAITQRSGFFLRP